MTSKDLHIATFVPNTVIPDLQTRIKTFFVEPRKGLIPRADFLYPRLARSNGRLAPLRERHGPKVLLIASEPATLSARRVNMAESFLFWAFQVINGLSASAMFFFPKRFHESLVPEPERTYRALGFSPLAVEMVHNVIRGQGAALLSITLFLAYTGPSSRESFLLIALAASLTLVAHVFTALHHMRSPQVMAAIGSLKSMVPLLALNALFALGGFAMFFTE